MGIFQIINIFDDDMRFYYHNTPPSMINPYTTTNAKIGVIHFLVLVFALFFEVPYSKNLMTIDIVSMIGYYYIFNRLIPNIESGKIHARYPFYSRTESESALLSLYIIIAQTAYARFFSYLIFQRRNMTLGINPTLALIMVAYTLLLIKNNFFVRNGISSKEYNAAINYIMATKEGIYRKQANEILFKTIKQYQEEQYLKREKQRAIEELKESELLRESFLNPMLEKEKVREESKRIEDDIKESETLLRRREREIWVFRMG